MMSCCAGLLALVIFEIGFEKSPSSLANLVDQGSFISLKHTLLSSNYRERINLFLLLSMSAPTLDLNQGYAPETGGAEKPLPSPSQPALPPIPNNGIIATNAQDTSEGKRPEIPPNGAKGDSEATPTAAQPPPRPASRKQASAKGGKAAPAPKSGKDSKAGKGDNSKQEASGDQQASQIEELKATIQAREGDLKLLSERLEEEKLARNKAELEQVRERRFEPD